MEKKDYLQQTFDSVAKGYDHPALSFFPQTARLLIDHLDPGQEATLLDVCSGTGVVALEAASALKQGKVTAIDLSEGMLNQARRKAGEQDLKNIEFLQMDLDHLAFPDQHFSHVTCSFGLFFLDDMEHAMRSIKSKVKKGGKVAISSFAEGTFEPMSSLFLERTKAYGYEAPPLSWKKITTDQQMADLFGQAGLVRLELYREPLGFYMTSAEDWWDIVWNAGYRGLLNLMSDTELARFKAEHMQEIQDLCDAGRVWMNTGVVIAIGEVV